MIAFTHSRVIRRCVSVVLAVWVFALMAGVANACLQHERQSGHDTQVQKTDGAGPNLVPVAAIEQTVDDAVQSHGPPSAIRFLRLRL